jgi:hypothetical protein
MTCVHLLGSWLAIGVLERLLYQQHQLVRFNIIT